MNTQEIETRLSRIETILMQLLEKQPLSGISLEQRIRDGLAKGMTAYEIVEEHNKLKELEKGRKCN